MTVIYEIVIRAQRDEENDELIQHKARQIVDVWNDAEFNKHHVWALIKAEVISRHA